VHYEQYSDYQRYDRHQTDQRTVWARLWSAVIITQFGHAAVAENSTTGSTAL